MAHHYGFIVPFLRSAHQSHYALVLWFMCLLLIARIIPAFAQTIDREGESPNHRFEHLTQEDGLSNGAILCLAQTRSGFLWAATYDGLNRYDGYTFKTYRNVIGDSSSLEDNTIFAIVSDKQGRFWAASSQTLHLYQPRTDNFRRYRVRFSRGAAPALRIIKIVQDSRQRIWVCTSHGVLLFHPDSGKFTEYLFPNAKSHNVGDMAEDVGGGFWIAGIVNGLWQFNPDADTARGQRIFTQQTHLLPPSAREYIQRLMTDKNGKIWVGTYNGLFTLNPVTKIIERSYLHITEALDERQRKNKENFIVPNLVMSMMQSRAGDVWVGTRENGVFRLDSDGKTMAHFVHKPLKNTSLVGNYGASLCEDASGILWIGDGSYGISKYVPYQQHFRLYRHNPNDSTSLSNDFIRGIHEDSAGRLWVSTQYGGVNMLDLKRTKNAWRRFPQNLADPLAPQQSWTIIESNNGKILVSSISGALTVIDPQKGTGKFYRLNDSLVTGVAAMMRDREQMLWLSLRGNVLRIGAQGQITQRYTNDELGIEALFQDQRGDIWLGGTEGLWCMKNDNHQSKHGIPYQPIEAVALPQEKHPYITMIMQDSHGTMWATSKGAGIFYAESPSRVGADTDLVWKHLSVKKGLPHQNNYAIIEDRLGQYWISSDAGICRYNYATGTFRTFTLTDGLQGLEYNRMAYCQLRSGEIAFGGINGLNIFDPLAVPDNTTPPALALTSLRVRDQEWVNAGQLQEAESLTFTHEQDFLSFDFAALDFTNAARNTFAYQLVGLESDWVYCGSRHQVTYTNLSPGTYTFRVKAANPDGYWNESGRALRITITPPWWRTWWAYLLYGFGAVSVMVLVMITAQKRRIDTLRRKQQEREEEMLRISNIQLSAANAETMRQKELVEQQNEHLQKLDQEKNEMMGLVAHDLKNPISAIRNLANLIETNQLEKEVVLDVAQSIATTSNRMLSLVSNLLDLNRLESGAMAFRIFFIDILPSVEGVFRQYQSQAAAKNITLHCTVEAVSTAALVDEQAIIEVLENLISNAVKYSPHGKNVFVRLNDEGKEQKEQNADSALPPAFLRVEVQDEGPGISPEDMKKLFTKFARLSAQPTGDEQSTGLGLSIVKKMVEAMNGKVWCESELGKGATFIVELPCATFIPDSDEASG